MKKILSTFVAFMVLFNGAIAQAVSFAPNLQSVNIGANLQAGFEPSGVVWHNRLHSLFVVWDNGSVVQIDENGNVLHPSALVGGDLEGITVVDDQSNYLYLLVEYPQQILEFDLSTWQLTGRSWNLQGMTGDRSSGAEALTYNSDRREFYVGSQYDGQIYVYNIDLSASGNPAVSRVIHTGVPSDIAGLSYSKEIQRTIAVFDSSNIIQEYTNDDQMVQQYDAPGVDQEGITLIPGCPAATTRLVIAQDSGGVLKFDSYPIQCPVAPVAPQVQPGRPVVIGGAANSNVLTKKVMTELLLAGPNTMVKDGVHSYDSKGEYSSITVPAAPLERHFEVTLTARATLLDFLYPLSVVTMNQNAVKTSQSQLVDCLQWKNYSYNITVPANTQTEIRIVSSVAKGKNILGVAREHQVKAITFTNSQAVIMR